MDSGRLADLLSADSWNLESLRQSGTETGTGTAHENTDRDFGFSITESIPADSLPGKKLIECARDVISTAAEAVGGRYVMIECREEDNLIQFYKENGFSEISRLADGAQPMVQMISKIC